MLFKKTPDIIHEDLPVPAESLETAVHVIPVYDDTGKVLYIPDVLKTAAAQAACEYPLSSPFSHSPALLSPDDLSDLPTLNESFNKSKREAFARTLDRYDDRILAKLNQPFGKDNLVQCFYAEPRLRHVLLPLWKSGFLFEDTKAWSALQAAYPIVATFHDLLRDLGDVDFRSLRGYPPNWESETSVNTSRVDMVSAALLHFDGSAADLVRWIGGPHVAQHRDHTTILQRLRASKIPQAVYNHVERIFLHGIPTYCNVSSTERNFQAFYAYGNHATMNEEPEKTLKALIKDNKKGYTLLFDPRLIPFLLNCHVTPQGVVDLNTLHKNPRPIFDSSFRPEIWSMAINDWTNKTNEPPLTFALAELVFMVWLYNLRISYPREEIYLADDDVSGAFRHAKYHPNMVAMHTSTACGFGVLNTGATFGDNTSPSNFDPIALARRLLAMYLWVNDDTVISRVTPFLPDIQFSPPPSLEEVTAFVPADADALNTGVFLPCGTRRPPPFPMHVDDNMYADVRAFLVLGVCASAAGLFDLLGWPNPVLVPTPLSMDKLETKYNHQRRMVGRIFDARSLSVGMLAYKRDNLISLLAEWMAKPSFTIQEIAQLLGALDNHTKYARWARCWYFTLQNLIRAALTQRFYVVKRLHRKFERSASHYSRALPPSLAARLSTLVSRDKAALLWSTHCTFTVTPPARQCITTLHHYVQSTPKPWETPLGMIIPRVPHFSSAGDASFVGCGGSCPGLGFWFDVPWSLRTRQAVKFRPTAPGFVHINDLEFVTLILMLAAIHVRLTTITTVQSHRFFPQGRPDIPVWLGLTDNMVSKSWESRATAKSARGQSLVGIYSSLLRATRVHTVCDHIPGEENIVADDISRNDFTLSLSARFEQLFAKHPSLASLDYFLPSPELLQLLILRLFSSPSPVPCDLPTNLGRFVPAGSTTFDSPSI